MTDHAINEILYKWGCLTGEDGTLIRNLLTDYLNLEQLQYYGFKNQPFGISGFNKNISFILHPGHLCSWQSLRSGEKNIKFGDTEMIFISHDVTTHSSSVWVTGYYVTTEIIIYNGLKTSFNKQHVFYVLEAEERSLEGKLIAYNYMPENIIPIVRFNSDESCFKIVIPTQLITAEELLRALIEEQRKAMIWYNVYLLNANIRNINFGGGLRLNDSKTMKIIRNHQYGGAYLMGLLCLDRVNLETFLRHHNYPAAKIRPEIPSAKIILDYLLLL